MGLTPEGSTTSLCVQPDSIHSPQLPVLLFHDLPSCLLNSNGMHLVQEKGLPLSLFCARRSFACNVSGHWPKTAIKYSDLQQEAGDRRVILCFSRLCYISNSISDKCCYPQAVPQYDLQPLHTKSNSLSLSSVAFVSGKT